MIVLGLDQSFTSTGCVIMDDGVVTRLERIVSNKDEDGFERARYVAEKIVQLVTEEKVACVWMENIAYGAVGLAAKDLAGLLYTIVLALRSNGVDVRLVSIGTLKKMATGKGNAKKEQMYECLPASIKEMLFIGKVLKSKGRSDLTDAYWLAKYGTESV